MSEFQNYNDLSGSIDTGFRGFMTKTFEFMAAGLILSAFIAFMLFNSLMSGGFVYDLLVSYGNRPILIISFIQLGIALFMSYRLFKMRSVTATLLFFAYCAITGVTFSLLPLIFGLSNVLYAFIFTAVLFVSCAIIGHTTKVDISKFSGLLIAGLITMIILSFASFIFKIEGLDLTLSYAGVILFLGITAWDTQKLKSYYAYYAHDDEMRNKLSIYGAFQLYLDFINLFLYILRILGRKLRR